MTGNEGHADREFPVFFRCHISDVYNFRMSLAATRCYNFHGPWCRSSLWPRDRLIIPIGPRDPHTFSEGGSRCSSEHVIQQGHDYVQSGETFWIVRLLA